MKTSNVGLQQKRRAVVTSPLPPFNPPLAYTRDLSANKLLGTNEKHIIKLICFTRGFCKTYRIKLNSPTWCHVTFFVNNSLIRAHVPQLHPTENSRQRLHNDFNYCHKTFIKNIGKVLSLSS